MPPWAPGCMMDWTGYPESWANEESAGQMSERERETEHNWTGHERRQTFNPAFGLPALILTKGTRLVDSLIIFGKF